MGGNMETELVYEVIDGKIVRATIDYPLDEIIGLINQKNGDRWALARVIEEKIARAVADRFILEHLDKVMSLIDPKHVANMASLNVLSALQGRDR
jgi:hypothetical protein